MPIRFERRHYFVYQSAILKSSLGFRRLDSAFLVVSPPRCLDLCLLPSTHCQCVQQEIMSRKSRKAEELTLKTHSYILMSNQSPFFWQWCRTHRLPAAYLADSWGIISAKEIWPPRKYTSVFQSKMFSTVGHCPSASRKINLVGSRQQSKKNEPHRNYETKLHGVWIDSSHETYFHFKHM